MQSLSGLYKSNLSFNMPSPVEAASGDKRTMLDHNNNNPVVLEHGGRRGDARSRFLATRPRTVQLDGKSLVRFTHLSPGEQPPRMVQPTVEGMDLLEWAIANRDLIEQEIQRNGCLLFRDFGISSAEKFERFAGGLCPRLYAEYGDLPEESRGKKVYGSTPFPEQKTILFHNESSHLNSWPLRMWFCCIQPAQEGGETPLADCRSVYNFLDKDVREEFAAKGLLYIRNFLPGFDVSWRKFFRTEDRSAIEAQCRKAGMQLEWWGDDCLRTRQYRPAVTVHPRTGETIFFNQILLHHTSCLEPEAREALLSDFGPEGMPRNVCYGDGSPIPDSEVVAVAAALEQASRAFPWQAGDVLMVDNMLVAHSRNPFRGPRKILVAMGEMLEQR